MDDAAPSPAPEAAPALPRPEERRRRPDITGRPLATPDGATWLLADGGLAPALRAIRDRVHDDKTLTSTARRIDLETAAFLMLHANYRLSDDEAATIVRSADDAGLAGVTDEALFPTANFRRTYSAWLEGALYANGLDPATIPARALPAVLRHLAATKRLQPPGEFIDADCSMAERAAALSV